MRFLTSSLLFSALLAVSLHGADPAVPRNPAGDPIYEARLPDFSEQTYGAKVETMLSQFEAATGRKLVPGPKKKVGIKIYTDSGPGLATPIPLVPFVGGAAGLAFGFPNGASAGAGLMVRAVGGANYFFFDWLGFGAQVGFSFGSLGYDSTFTGSHTYEVLDVGGGLVFQF